MEASWEQIQKSLKDKIILKDKLPKEIKYAAGVDISFPKNTNTTKAYAAIVVIEFATFKLVYKNCIKVEVSEPYIAGFLAFREVRHYVTVFNTLKSEAPQFTPDVILVDGNGILHYRDFGVASHLGVLLGVPTIGIGKNLLYVDGLNRESVRKEFDEKCKQKGDFIPLIGNTGVTYGAALKPCENVIKPIFVSIGHMIDLERAIDIVIALSKYRVPEPVRLADQLSRQAILTPL